MENEMTMKKVATFQQRFKELCASNMSTDTALADKLGVSKQTISSWKSGHRVPKKPMISMIANHFGVSVEWLMGYDAPKIKQKRRYIVDAGPKRLTLKKLRPAVINSGDYTVKGTVNSMRDRILNGTASGVQVYGYKPATIVPDKKMDDKTVRMLKLVGRMAKDDPESAVELLKVLVDKDVF